MRWRVELWQSSCGWIPLYPFGYRCRDLRPEYDTVAGAAAACETFMSTSSLHADARLRITRTKR